jgi:hypothetical protein
LYVNQLRSLVLGLRPTMLESAGLAATLIWLAKQYEERTGLDLAVRDDGVGFDVAKILEEAPSFISRRRVPEGFVVQPGSHLLSVVARSGAVSRRRFRLRASASRLNNPRDDNGLRCKPTPLLLSSGTLDPLPRVGRERKFLGRSMTYNPRTFNPRGTESQRW